MKIGDFGMSRQIIMASSAEGEMGLERALSSNIIGTAAYCAPELLLAESPVKRNKASAATILKSDVSHCDRYGLSLTWLKQPQLEPSEVCPLDQHIYMSCF